MLISDLAHCHRRILLVLPRRHLRNIPHALLSVRSRSLSSLLTREYVQVALTSAVVIVVTVMLYGKFLDLKRYSLRTRAWAGFAMWLIPQFIGFIWTGVLYGHWGGKKTTYDYGL